MNKARGDDVQRICVFCGSSSGLTDQYLAAATGLGTLLADKGIGLVYGGAAVGLMGAVADAAMKAGGEVIGVIPKALVDREVAHTGLKDLRVVSSMHERKALMAELSDAFIAMPGGIGTFEEIFEVWTWTQLGSHAKPCALLNVGGFYDQLLGFLDHVVNESFMKSVHRDMLLVENDPMSLLARLETFVVPSETKWIGKNER
nr:TIGR00730 family Rossman fold protein [Agrobacterium rubi]